MKKRRGAIETKGKRVGRPYTNVKLYYAIHRAVLSWPPAPESEALAPLTLPLLSRLVVGIGLVVAEEYGPSLMRVAANGTVLVRFSPRPLRP